MFNRIELQGSYAEVVLSESASHRGTSVSRPVASSVCSSVWGEVQNCSDFYHWQLYVLYEYCEVYNKSQSGLFHIWLLNDSFFSQELTGQCKNRLEQTVMIKMELTSMPLALGTFLIWCLQHYNLILIHFNQFRIFSFLSPELIFNNSLRCGSTQHLFTKNIRN